MRIDDGTELQLVPSPAGLMISEQVEGEEEEKEEEEGEDCGKPLG